VGWRLSEEAFMRRVRPVSDLKLRASYGVTGNQEIDLYTYSTYVGFGRNYNFGNQVATGVSPANITNPDVRWESTTQADIGLDLGLWANRVTFTADYYVKNTDGMLVKKPISRVGGSLDAPTVNIGKVSNRGLELALAGQVLTGTFGWTTDLNFSTNRNELVSLGGGEPIIGREITRSVEGQPIGQFYGWVTDGIFQTEEQVTNSPRQRDGTKPGDVKFVDQPDKDGVYNNTIGDEDRTFIGNPQPRFIYGLTNAFSCKGLELSVFLQGVQGNDLYNQLRENLEGMAFDANQARTTLDRWTGEGTGNAMPRAVAGDPARNRRRSDRYVEDGSYLRVRNVTLGYSLPAKVVQALRMQRVRMYVSAQNAFTFTRYSGLDPEIGSYNQSSLASGIDYGTYPVPRTLLAGLNLSF
jgi:TonB-linked SusC/RagA family outer membrane protein